MNAQTRRLAAEQAASPADAAYAGSTFAEVRDALFAGPRYYDVWGGPGRPPLPVHPLRLRDLLRGALCRGHYPFARAAERTVDSRADLRWGPDGKGVRRLLHPNGVCLTGTWEVTEPTAYSGYFRQGSTGLVVGRYSTGGRTRRGEPRSLALVAKLYPTTDPADPVKYRPASLITQEDFGGPGSAYVNDAELRNAPDTHAWRRGLTAAAMLAVTGLVLRRADVKPTFRQLHEIAELGKPAGEPTRSPEFLRLLVDEAQPRVPGDRIDFRDEVLAQIYDPGDPQPRRRLVFHVEVSDSGESRGPLFFQRRIVTDWRRIGRLVFTEAVASHNGDFVVHFHHPAWRTDRNDPATAVREARRRSG
ncbi:hypothetical protein J0H58_22815 [bacterium]|nr:hypothetical protein [bacterium]